MDEYSRFNVCLHVSRSITAEQVIEQLELAMAHGKPDFIRSDNAPEFIATAISAHLNKKQIGTIYVESFHSRLRDECLNREIFTHLLEVELVLSDFRQHYNDNRPHSALNYKAPASIFFGTRGPDATPELFTAASSTPTSMVTHSRLVGSHNSSTPLTT
ncbi:MAG: putative transposase [Rhodothermales bacterium]|jgi:putative transposase